MEDNFQDDIDVEELVGFEFSSDVGQRAVEALLAVVQQKVLHARNELAHVAQHRRRPLLFGLPRALDKVLQTAAERRAAVTTQLHDEYLNNNYYNNYYNNYQIFIHFNSLFIIIHQFHFNNQFIPVT